MINIENGGVSNARNIGIKNATGKYLMFVDSDDYIISNMVEELLINMEENQWVICSKYSIYPNKIIDEKKEDINDFSFSLKDFWKIYSMKVLNPPYCKLYLKQIIDENNITFNKNISMGEDLIFNFDYFKYISSAKFINKSLYYYDMTSSTLTHKRYKNICDIKEEMITKCQELLVTSNHDCSYDLELFKIDILTDSPLNYLKYYKQYLTFRKKDICTISLDLVSKLSLIKKFLLKRKFFVLYGIFKRLRTRFGI